MRLLRTDAAAALVVALGALLFAEPILAQQTGTVTGTVRSETGAPVFAANVDAQGTGIRSFSQQDGRYTLLRVPVGEQTIRARVMGFAPATVTVMVRANEVVTADLSLTPQAVALSEVVVTGAIGATERAKLPFTVDQLRAEDMPVTHVNFASALRAKVPGATVVQGSGRPGAAPSILLRGATSIGATGRSQEPLYIVDGVILGASVVDIDALDIETIEIVKGAAAASLYGSRAANGVVVITTQRGTGFADGQVRYTARSTLGLADLEGEFPLLNSHFWALGPDGRFIDGGTQQPCDFRGAPGWNPNEECSSNMQANGTNAWNTYANNPWPNGTFDHVDRFYDGGVFQEYYVAASGRQGATNFHVSFSRTNDQGPMLGQDGFKRNNFRLNLDQVVRPNVQVSASAFYSRSVQESFGEGSGNPVFGLTRMPAGVDLTACEPLPDPNNPGVMLSQPGSCLDRPQQLLLNVNPTNIESANPLYELLARKGELARGRFLASTNLRYSPRVWADIDADISYDRLDTESSDYRPKGFRTIDPGTLNEGTLGIGNQTIEAINASLTASFRHDFSDGIVNRTRVRYLYEQSDDVSNSTSGREFGVVDVPTLGNLNSETLSSGSGQQTVVADGYFLITNFDIYDRYIIDALVRNDGSSLFGADERRHWYGRIAGAWRMAQEDWFDIPAIDEFKLRYSYGTAGGRPAFAAQYETFSVSGGTIIPVNLGNRDLKPEQSAEHEMGFDLSLYNRIDLSLTYAQTDTENQILSVPLPAFTGFSSQVLNVGTLTSKTWEASLGAVLMQTPDLTWSARVLYDQTRSIITELNRPDFRFGVGGQNMGNVFLAREGERMGTFYGPIPARSCADLPQGMSCDGFVTDSNGYLVWVGVGGSLSDNAWGTSSGLTDGRGSAINWGAPIAGECTDASSGERTNFCNIGNTMPDHSVSFSSNLDWRGLSLYGLIEAVRGFDVWNQPLSWALFRRNIDMMDQTGIPEAQQRPIGYYDNLYGGLGGLVPNGEFVEDGSFVKLRELSLRYRLSADQLSNVPGLSGFGGLAFSVSGRNLKTWSDYRGYDPEVGRTGGSVGSAAIARVDGFNYPNFRTWTFGVEVNF
jgi:TonB-linked SusC/RagA family outer membrane protein